MKTVRIYINGTVQSSFFKTFIKEQADALSIRGFVRSLEDGRVEVLVEGKDENVKEMIVRCKQGPKHAQIIDVKVEDMKYQGFEGFKILKV
jgi:acylphosphatase